MPTLWQDLRYALRMLIKTPGFTAAAVIALALGVGINTAVFSVVNAVLLRSLPFPDADRLVAVKSINPGSGSTQFGAASPADFFDWRAGNQSFEALAAYSGTGVTLAGTERPERIVGARVSEDFFKALKIQPMLGRAFAPEEFTTSGPFAIILSHRFWQQRFGGDAEIIGKTVPIDDESATIAGVMPPDFKLPAYAEVWTPMMTNSSEMRTRGNRYFTIIARLKPGISIEQAQSDMSAVTARLGQSYPESNSGWSATVENLQENMVADVRSALWILFGAVCFVLLIACVNVANLLLARSTARQKEIAIRAALGATRARVVRQLLTESLLLAVVGGVVGLLLAMWSLDALLSLVPEGWSAVRLPRVDEVRIDGYVLAFTSGIALLTGLVFGLIPSLQVSKPDLAESLKEGGRSSTSVRMRRTRSLLVVSEVALTLLLLVGAGLLIRSLLTLQKVDTGFNPQNLVTMQISARMSKYAQSHARATFYQELVRSIASQPDVESAAATSSTPLGFSLVFPFFVEERGMTQSEAVQAAYSSVSPGYLRTMGIPLVEGREFTERDAADTTSVAIINETLARRYFLDETPIGKRLKVDYLGSQPSFEIIGVAKDIRQLSLSDTPGFEIYVSNLQRPWFMTALIVRAKGDAASAALSAQRAIGSVEPTLPVSDVKTIDQLISEAVAQPRFYAVLLGAFAFVALALAAVGIYGLISYSVAQRTHEIGIRVAMGARASDVLRLIVGQAMALAAAGIAIGLAGAFALSRLLEKLLFGVSAIDPITFALVPVILIGVALAASFVPARRALRVDPVVALRYE